MFATTGAFHGRTNVPTACRMLIIKKLKTMYSISKIMTVLCFLWISGILSDSLYRNDPIYIHTDRSEQGSVFTQNDNSRYFDIIGSLLRDFDVTSDLFLTFCCHYKNFKLMLIYCIFSLKKDTWTAKKRYMSSRARSWDFFTCPSPTSTCT